MKQDATNAIPRITADFITATSAIADRGLQVDDLTVRELIQLAQESHA